MRRRGTGGHRPREQPTENALAMDGAFSLRAGPPSSAQGKGIACVATLEMGLWLLGLAMRELCGPSVNPEAGNRPFA